MEHLPAKALTFAGMMESLVRAADACPDTRTGKNLHFSFHDIVCGAFSVFFTQSPSFLSHQTLMKQRYGISNARTVFQVKDIPTDTHIRQTLDTVSPSCFTQVFDDCLAGLEQGKFLDDYRWRIGEKNDLLITLDGTYFFFSESIHCDWCGTKKKDGVRMYFHEMITPTIVAPGKRQVISLPAEFIVPQDGHEKQDCENAAGKRWLKGQGKKYAQKEVTLLADDLYCHEPMIRDIIAAGYNYVLVCKPQSHTTLYEWINGIQEEKVEHKKNKSIREKWTYRWCSGVPLTDAKDSTLVNWCEVTIINTETKEKIFKNAWVTNHPVTAQTVAAISAAGRARWKIENENNNTLKNQGYHLEHNYGHGKKYLTQVLATMNLLAFLFHTILEMTHEIYLILRHGFGKRENLFHSIRTLLTLVCFRSFDSLMQFMLDGLKKPHDPATLKVPI